MAYDLVVYGRIPQGYTTVKGCVAVKDGKIIKLGRSLTGDRVMDMGGMLVLPAAVDMHVHMREPGFAHKEDFGSGTMSAAFGGVTCVADMPNTNPLTKSKEGLEEKLDAMKKANVDCAAYGLLSPDSDLRALAKGTLGLKLYMYEHPPETWPELLAMAGERFLSVHAEHPAYLDNIKVTTLEEHLRARPHEAEVEAVRALAESGRGVHVAHVSTVDSWLLLANTKCTCEATPHHLYLTCRSRLGPLGKMNPPLRTRHDRDSLWDALRVGEIDVVASDHAPHTLEEKREFSTAPSGVPGVETIFPLMLKAVRDGELEMRRCLEACCERPAQLLGLKKGKLAEGYDADIIAIDLKASRKVRGDELHSKCGWTPFEGFELPFPKLVMLRGTPIIADGELAEERKGKIILPIA
ncbi:MAG: dihydroorotase [Euryarchaeota archaeon]|nr:dihydroorotase [Euryarchaeota archaeon]